MNRYGPRIATTTPRTLEKQRDVMEAMRALAARERGQIHQRQADVAALRRDLELLRGGLSGLIRQSIDEARRECGLLLRSYLRKYSPDQPRVPAGNPDGGEWTDGGGGESSADRPSPNGSGQGVLSEAPVDSSDGPPEKGRQYAALDTETATDATAGGTGVQVAASPGYPVDLLEEEALGGHTIAQHVGKSDQYLLSRIREDMLAIESRGDRAVGLTEAGSFPSLEAANKLVNSTLDQNSDTVELVVKGLLSRAALDADFRSATGYEAYAKTERSVPYMRATYSVRVVIVSDPSSSKGYRVLTAFPRNR